MGSYQLRLFDHADLMLEGEAVVYGGIGLPDRAPAAVRAQSEFMGSLSTPDWFLTAERQFYGQEHSTPYSKTGFSLGMQRLNLKSLQRFSISQSFRTSLWHDLIELPKADRELHGAEYAILCYEFLQLNGIQLSIGLTRAADWGEISSRPSERPGLFNRTAWQWPGQENSRLGFGMERDHTLSHRSFSILFENQGFNGQTLSAEYVRRKDTDSLLIVSLKPPESLDVSTQAIFTIHKNKTWQLDLDRQHTLWHHFLSHIRLELKRDLELGFKTTFIAGIGGKI